MKRHRWTQAARAPVRLPENRVLISNLLIPRPAPPKSFVLKIVFPFGTTVERSGVTHLTVPTPDGKLEIWPDASNLMAAVTPGIASLRFANKAYQSLAVQKGILVKSPKTVVIFTHTVGENDDAKDTGTFSPWRRPATAAEIILRKMRDRFIESILRLP